MGFRFRRSVRLLPGIRLNISKSGASLSLGAPGATVNIGSRGTYGTVGIPGTGMSYRQRLDQPSGRNEQSHPSEPVRCSIRLVDNLIAIETEDGRRLGPDDEQRALRDNAVAIKQMLEQIAAERNEELERALVPSVSFEPTSLAKPQRQASESQADYMDRLGRWRAQAANNMENHLVAVLESVNWGRETNISCQIGGARVLLDIDLPEIENMPDYCWKPAPRGQALGLIRICLPASATNRRYAHMVAATVRTAVDVLFTHLAGVSSVAVSAYTTRNGHDDYVAVADIDRVGWSPLVRDPDHEIYLGRLGARMEMTSTGRLKPQRPITS